MIECDEFVVIFVLIKKKKLMFVSDYKNLFFYLWMDMIII